MQYVHTALTGFPSREEVENEDNESGISSTGYDSDGSHSQVSLPESIDSSQGDNKSHEASTEWELEPRQREECSDYKEMGERVLMWGEDSYDDTLTAKQESQETHVAALAKGLQGGHMSPLPVEFNVVVTFNEKSSFYLKASGIELEKTTTPTNSPINVGRIEADICLNKNVIEEEYVPYNIRWRIGCMTGKMVLAFDPKTSIQEGICNTVQAVYNPNLRLSHQEYTARPYEHLAWDRDIDNQVDFIYEKYWEKLIADVRHASRQINTILKMNKQPQETRQTNPTGMMASHISVIEQWIMSILDTRNEP